MKKLKTGTTIWNKLQRYARGMSMRKAAAGFSFLIPAAAFLLPGGTARPGKSLSGKDTSVQLLQPALVNRFYRMNRQQLFWFSPGEPPFLLRQALKKSVDSRAGTGLDKRKYHDADLNQYAAVSFSSSDSIRAMTEDRVFTDIALAFSKDIYQGIDIGHWVNADEISLSYSATDDDYILNRLLSVRSAPDLLAFFNSLEPEGKEYQLLKAGLLRSSIPETDISREPLAVSLHLTRWIEHFHLGKYIVVNIPSATLRYFDNDSLKLKMKVVLGKPSTRTPRFAAYCNGITLYPYWNVPRKIMLNEYLPLFKRFPAAVERMNMQIIDRKGKSIDADTIDWPAYNKKNFPYRLRQSTGCDNALGVIKFNLTSPYDVYMHDTNMKSAFKSAYRYYSHGCIRLEKPLELAGDLLDGKLDSVYLLSCLKNQKPVTLPLKRPVPVFVVYMPAEINERGEIEHFRDIYRLLGK